ncbi:MAG: hypothetical protein LLG00_11380 [Planctomycetaceae bacterium]|nr:hypothetical protein [Planctomycetaceae bacterium]
MNAGVCESKMQGESSQRCESPIGHMIESQTAKLPSDAFLWAAFGSIGLSLTMWMMGRQHTAHFIGQWAPTFLVLGLYSKMIKLAEHEEQR